MPLLKPKRVRASERKYVPPQGKSRAYGIWPVQGIKGVAPPIGPPPAPPGPTTETIYPEADAYVQSAIPDTNYGSATNLGSGVSQYPNIVRTYLRFNLSAVIPAGRIIDYGKLYVDVYSIWGTLYYQRKFDLCFVSSDTWGELTITWNNKPAVGTVLINDTVIDTVQWYNYDITSQVQTEYAGDGKISLCWMHHTENTSYWEGWYAYSKEYATEAYRPYLKVKHSPT